MVAIFVITGSGIRKLTGMAWSPVSTVDFHGKTTAETCALLPIGERPNCSGRDQVLWTGPRELRGPTTTGPVARCKCTAVGFPVITLLASFWNSEHQRFRTLIFIDQSQSMKIQVRICSEHGNFRRKTLASCSFKWPCHDLAFVCSINKISQKGRYREKHSEISVKLHPTALWPMREPYGSWTKFSGDRLRDMTWTPPPPLYHHWRLWMYRSLESSSWDSPGERIHWLLGGRSEP